MSLVTVENLHITINEQPIISGISFSLGVEKLAIVGESGAGKSLTVRTLLGLLPSAAYIRSDKLLVLGTNILAASRHQMQQLRGSKVALIPQDPKIHLNPVKTIGWQISESFYLHQKITHEKIKTEVIDLLHNLNIQDPKRVYSLYPHQVSGGIGQRAIIAMMLACKPEILICDEATSACDAETQTEILSLLDNIATEQNLALVIISHNLPLVSKFCDRAIIMHKGKIIENCKAEDIARSNHLYTKTLWSCIPDKSKKNKKLAEFNHAASQ